MVSVSSRESIVQFHGNPASGKVQDKTRDFTVAMVDDFKGGHSDLTTGVLKKYLTHLQINPIAVNHNGVYYEVSQALKQLDKQVEEGQHYDAINLSMGDIIPRQELTQKLGLSNIPAAPISDTKALNRLKGQIVQALQKWARQHPNTVFSSAESKTTEDFLQSIQLLSHLATDHHIPTFVAAGYRPDDINFFTLAQNVHGVGVLKQVSPGGSSNPQLTPWGNNPKNPFVTQYALGEHTLQTGNGSEKFGPFASLASPMAIVTYAKEQGFS